MTAECGTAKHSHGKVRHTKLYTFCSLSPITQIDYFSVQIMSRLNAGAYEFVPGKGFGTPIQLPVQPPPPPPLERPQQTEAPPPPPTITLNIGGSAPIPAAALSHGSPKPAAFLPSATTLSSKAASPAPTSAPSKVFSTEKSKTDTNAIAREVQSVADASVLEDLYGDSTWDHS
jgi:peptide chain release factor subunit 3